MPAVWRIRDRRTFSELRRRGRRARSGPIAVTWLPGPPGTPPRVAYAIGRPVGSAVARNRLRRRLRAVVSGMSPELQPGAYLLTAGPDASALEPSEMTTTVADVLRRVTGRAR